MERVGELSGLKEVNSYVFFMIYMLKIFVRCYISEVAFGYKCSDIYRRMEPRTL
jgi:hypothetical protein